MFTLKFTTGNAAFMTDDGQEDSWIEAEESARILEGIASRLKKGDRQGKVIDFNGNGIGEWELK